MNAEDGKQQSENHDPETTGLELATFEDIINELKKRTTMFVILAQREVTAKNVPKHIRDQLAAEVLFATHGDLYTQIGMASNFIAQTNMRIAMGHNHMGSVDADGNFKAPPADEQHRGDINYGDEG